MTQAGLNARLYQRRLRLRSRQSVLFNPRIQLRASQAKELGRARFVVPRLRERFHDERALDVFQIDAACR